MQRCRWCGRGFTPRAGPGRPRAFCTQACRQRDYISRLRAREAGLSEAELIVLRAELDDLRDKLYVLECAIADARADTEGTPEPDEYARALAWVMDAAEPLLTTRLGETGAT